MPYREPGPISKQLTIVIGLTVVGFMAFGLALSFYRNILFETTMESMHGSNGQLRDQIAQAYGDLDYYTSPQFKDKYAKENLNQLNPGEKVLIITEKHRDPDLDSTEHFTPTEQQKVAFDELLRQMPVIDHWNLYLLHRDELERLRRSM